jgi:hypothetical protein
MTEQKITTLASLKKLAHKTETVALIGLDEDTPFVCRLRRSGLRQMITAGKIPNQLLAAAQRLYEGAGSKATANIKDMLKVMETVVDDALVEPKLIELREAGIELTEPQFGAIFNYAQHGIKAVQPFLFQPADPDAGADGAAVADTAE